MEYPCRSEDLKAHPPSGWLECFGPKEIKDVLLVREQDGLDCSQGYRERWHILLQAAGTLNFPAQELLDYEITDEATDGTYKLEFGLGTVVVTPLDPAVAQRLRDVEERMKVTPLAGPEETREAGAARDHTLLDRIVVRPWSENPAVIEIYLEALN